MKNKEIENRSSRRSFIKKAAYVVPTVIALSQITNPTSAEARKQTPAGNTSYIGGTTKQAPIDRKSTSGGVFPSTDK